VSFQIEKVQIDMNMISFIIDNENNIKTKGGIFTTLTIIANITEITNGCDSYSCGSGMFIFDTFYLQNWFSLRHTFSKHFQFVKIKQFSYFQRNDKQVFLSSLFSWTKRLCFMVKDSFLFFTKKVVELEWYLLFFIKSIWISKMSELRCMIYKL